MFARNTVQCFSATCGDLMSRLKLHKKIKMCDCAKSTNARNL